ncbi:MAG: O-antigen ligase family protein [Anaerolineae bacterium]|nr:O-antigen ligase family protein [Anaerolineae bacterium]
MCVRPRSWVAWIADQEIWLLIAGVSLVMFTSRWATWGLGTLAVAWFLRWLGRGSPTVRTALDGPAILLLVTIPVTLAVTSDRRTTFTAVSRLLAGLALCYGLANWARERSHFPVLTLGLAAAGIGLALFATVSVIWPVGSKLPIIPRAFYSKMTILVSDTINANMMAGALMMILPFVVSMTFFGDKLSSASGAVPASAARLLDSRWVRRLWFGTSALLVGTLLVLTKSRGGWIAGGVSLFVLLAGRWPRMLWLIPAVLLAFGLLLWRGEASGLLDAVVFAGSSPVDDPGSIPPGWSGRPEIWSRAIYMIQDFPLTGIGAGTFASVADVLYPFLSFRPHLEVTHAHNLFLQIAVDLGLPGLVAYLAILLLSLWGAVSNARFYRRTGQYGQAALAWAGLSSLAGMLVHGTVDATTWIVGRGSFLPWVVVGTIVAQSGIRAADGCEQTNSAGRDTP